MLLKKITILSTKDRICFDNMTVLVCLLAARKLQCIKLMLLNKIKILNKKGRICGDNMTVLACLLADNEATVYQVNVIKKD